MYHFVTLLSISYPKYKLIM